MKPRVFIFENVPGFATIHSGTMLEWLLSHFASSGYSLWRDILRACDFGDPTIRRRYFVLGFRYKGNPTPPSATHGPIEGDQLYLPGMEPEPLLPYVTTQEALDGLPAPGDPSAPINHNTINHLPHSVRRFENLSFGERDEIRRRNLLHPDKPAYTLFVGGIKGKLQARTHVHPFEPRELTPRECARLHSFPDYWQFAGPHDAALQQIANSVPIKLARAKAKHVSTMLREMDSVG